MPNCAALCQDIEREASVTVTVTVCMEQSSSESNFWTHCLSYNCSWVVHRWTC